jgi:hypothetical protein
MGKLVRPTDGVGVELGLAEASPREPTCGHAWVTAEPELGHKSRRSRERAGASAFSPPLRALGAVHLATALSMAEDLDAFFAYDADLCAAAAGEGLPVRSPA